MNSSTPVRRYIMKSLDVKGYSPIIEVFIDDGVWEVEAYKNGLDRELKVNPITTIK